MAFHATLSYTLPYENNYLYHALDIYKIGGEVSDYNLAEILARRSEEEINYLISIGVPFVRREDGKIDQFLTDGSEYPRACYVGPNTAIEISKALMKRLRETKVEIYENIMVYDFIVKDNRVIGAKAINVLSQEKYLIQGKAFILATGRSRRTLSSKCFYLRDDRRWLCSSIKSRCRTCQYGVYADRYMPSQHSLC